MQSLNKFIYHFHNLKAIKISVLVILILICIIPASYCSICEASSSYSNAIISDQGIITSYKETQCDFVISGLISNSLYYLYFLNSPTNSGIRKINSDDSLAWLVILPFEPIAKGLVLDADEKHVFVSSYTNILDVARLGSSTGSIVDSQRFPFLSGSSFDVKIHPISDGSGYYVIGMDTSLIANFCKYMFSTSTSAQCQLISNFSKNAFGTLKISDTTLFMLGFYERTFPGNLHLYKHTFGNTSPDWAYKLSCPAGFCFASFSESLLISSKIYSFIAYGSNNKYVYLAEMSVSTGSVTNRYKSSTSCDGVYGSGASGDYIAASMTCVSDFILMLNIVTNVFTIISFSGIYLNGIGKEPATGRFVITALMNSQGYISKFMPQSLISHPDFTEGTWTMNALSSGIEEITLDSDQIIGSITSQTMGTSSITSAIGTYVQKASYTSDVNFRTNGQNYSISENSTVRIASEQPCSISGSTSISYSIGDYDRTVPSWISIDSQTGIITIKTPIISSETKYNFYLNSAVSEISNSIQKLIGLTVLKCEASNCLKCSDTSGTICQICNSSYIISSEMCSSPTSSKTSIPNSELSIDTPKALKITVISAIFTTALYSSFTICVNPSSIVAVWLAVEQYQMYLLLLTTRAFIPEDIKTVVKGLDFSSNIYEYIPYKKMGLYFFKNFEFDLTNSVLQDLEINFNSTFANMYSFIASLIFLITFYLIILLLNKLLSKCKENKSCWYIAPYKTVSKIAAIMTFSVFIRNFLEITQFVMLSSINELHVFDI